MRKGSGSVDEALPRGAESKAAHATWVATQKERHGRFAATCLLYHALQEVAAEALEESVWGRADGITKHGISRGQIQRMQSDLSKRAGMAAAMAAAVGDSWWMVHQLLVELAAQAAAGARTDLAPLMKMP
eukprot:CAMPEP_0175046344 /NCGR_PEP_ID=MMETSP0052_2-20121109/4981_1 /TAXON_ID=51329 ORGANISM="Polytomella parva, Strain SAG 63-3" /NCGR_SAMPLE_ID=MMETSP0052_2 /ASSEMBLY_ACC=CAM_ASM_000194 /LENGTH=129 /DNA_ID=CAMNT_0016310085 /DNA_START=16 /DNA_END=401 /DNA_ORIENTATION=-